MTKSVFVCLYVSIRHQGRKRSSPLWHHRHVFRGIEATSDWLHTKEGVARLSWFADNLL